MPFRAWHGERVVNHACPQRCATISRMGTSPSRGQRSEGARRTLLPGDTFQRKLAAPPCLVAFPAEPPPVAPALAMLPPTSRGMMKSSLLSPVPRPACCAGITGTPPLGFLHRWFQSDCPFGARRPRGILGCGHVHHCHKCLWGSRGVKDKVVTLHALVVMVWRGVRGGWQTVQGVSDKGSASGLPPPLPHSPMTESWPCTSHGGSPCSYGGVLRGSWLSPASPCPLLLAFFAAWPPAAGTHHSALPVCRLLLPALPAAAVSPVPLTS